MFLIIVKNDSIPQIHLACLNHDIEQVDELIKEISATDPRPLKNQTQLRFTPLSTYKNVKKSEFAR